MPNVPVTDTDDRTAAIEAIRAASFDAIRAASFDAPKAGSHTEWAERIGVILDGYQAAQLAAARTAPSFVGKAKANPATLYMDGTSPVTVLVRATTDELRALHNQTVEIRLAGTTEPAENQP